MGFHGQTDECKKGMVQSRIRRCSVRKRSCLCRAITGAGMPYQSEDREEIERNFRWLKYKCK